MRLGFLPGWGVMIMSLKAVKKFSSDLQRDQQLAQALKQPEVAKIPLRALLSGEKNEEHGSLDEIHGSKRKRGSCKKTPVWKIALDVLAFLIGIPAAFLACIQLFTYFSS
jgi:hypothetical protein